LEPAKETAWNTKSNTISRRFWVPGNQGARSLGEEVMASGKKGNIRECGMSCRLGRWARREYSGRERDHAVTPACRGERNLWVVRKFLPACA
jgi:hypothetical protein